MHDHNVNVTKHCYWLVPAFTSIIMKPEFYTHWWNKWRKEKQRHIRLTQIQWGKCLLEWCICQSMYPAWGRGTPFRLCCSLVHSLPHLLLFITFSLFPFLIHFTYFPLLSIRSLSTRIVPLCFQARGRKRRPNLGLVCLIYDCVICIA